jgi:hypothetical protein
MYFRLAKVDVTQVPTIFIELKRGIQLKVSENSIAHQLSGCFPNYCELSGGILMDSFSCNEYSHVS